MPPPLSFLRAPSASPRGSLSAHNLSSHATEYEVFRELFLTTIARRFEVTLPAARGHALADALVLRTKFAPEVSFSCC